MNCEYCGKQIAKRKKGNKKFCSMKCRAEMQRKKRYCLVCGKEVREPHQFICKTEKCIGIYNRCAEYAKQEYKKHHEKYLESKKKSPIKVEKKTKRLNGYRGLSWCKNYDDTNINCVMCYENKDKSNCEE